jgi:hypothetical protein
VRFGEAPTGKSESTRRKGLISQKIRLTRKVPGPTENQTKKSSGREEKRRGGGLRQKWGVSGRDGPVGKLETAFNR